MRACIHRGANVIGGSIVELEADGKRLILDMGLPLDADATAADDLLPDIPGLWSSAADAPLEGVILSHGHPDHVGLAHRVHAEVPIYAGAATRRISEVAAFFVPRAQALATAGELSDGVTLELGPFRVTPTLVDHSAFDAYALVVEAAGKRLVYSGDIRSHGRKPRSLERLARRGHGADVLLLEGTRIGRAAAEQLTEPGVEDRLVDICRDHRGWVLVAASAQNVDRLVSMFKAARRSGRELVLDLYAAQVLEATGRDTIPQASWDGVRVYLPKTQKRRVLDAKAFDRTERVKHARIYPEELAARSHELVLLYRESMSRELGSIGVPPASALVWSMWTGYLESDSGRRLTEFCRRSGVALEVCHASGHASVEDLRQLVETTRPRRVVPIHTERAGDYATLFRESDVRPDGQWFNV